MRKYQEDIFVAVLDNRDFMGGNVTITTTNNVTEVVYYRTKIAVIDHNKKTVHYDNGGFTNAATTARINAVKAACEDRLHYKVV